MDDQIHLSNIGNMKLSNTIIRKLKSLCSSSTSDPIMKIPSLNEVNHNDDGSNIDVPSISMSNSFVPPPPVSRYVKPMVQPSFTPAPECDYDHSKALQQVLLKEPHDSVPISSRSESRKKRRDKKKGFSVGGHPPRLLVSSSSQSPPAPPLPQLSVHQSTVNSSCSLLRSSSFCGSFVSFLMMVLSNFILPLSSSHVQHGQRILEFFKCRAMVFFLLLMTFSFLLAFPAAYFFGITLTMNYSIYDICSCIKKLILCLLLMKFYYSEAYLLKDFCFKVLKCFLCILLKLLFLIIIYWKRFNVYESFCQNIHFLWDLLFFAAKVENFFILVFQFFWKDTIFCYLFDIFLNRCHFTFSYLKKIPVVMFIFILFMIDDLIFLIPYVPSGDISPTSFLTQPFLGQDSRIKGVYFSLHVKILLVILLALSKAICFIRQASNKNKVPRSKKYFIKKRYHRRCVRNRISLKKNTFLLALLLTGNSSITIKPLQNFHEVLFYDICFTVSKKVFFRNNSNYSWLLLLLSNDVEQNPGPVHQDNYSFGHPYLCGFYRIALLDMLNSKKDIKNIFNEYFSISELDLSKILKNKQRYVNIFSKWGKNRGREDREDYLETFSTENWLKLDTVEKEKHSVLCKECETTYIQIHSKFPSNSQFFFAEKQRLKALADKSCNDNLKVTCEKLKPKLKTVLDECVSELQCATQNKKISKKNLQTLTMEITEELDDSFLRGSNNETNFIDTFVKFNRLIPKISRNEKRNTERKIIKKVVSKINDRNDKFAVNRLYGGGFSLRAWDAERKRKSFETVEEARKRSEENETKLSSGEKKPKDHVGPLTSYNIDTNAIESLASTWDSSSKVVWKRLGEQFVTNKRKISPSNSGQVIKKYLLSKEKRENFILILRVKMRNRKRLFVKLYSKLAKKLVPPLICHQLRFIK